MRVVVDTNVVVSGLLTPGGRPALVLSSLELESVAPLLDQRILDEYRNVLVRPALALPAEVVRGTISFFERQGKRVSANRLDVELPDPDDLPFLEVAFTGRADALVTGNLKHYPPASRCGVRVVGPAAYLRLLDAK